MKGVFGLSVRWMNGLRIPQKFMVLALIYLVAVGAVGFKLYDHLRGVVAVSQGKIDGLDAVKPVLRTIELLQAHRGLSAGVLGGNASMREALAANALQTMAAFKAVDAGAPFYAPFRGDWQSIVLDWDSFRSIEAGWPAAESFVRHTELLKRMRTLLRRAADRNALSFDPDIDAHYLLDTAIVQLPHALEVVAQIRGLGTHILARKSITPDQRLHMQALLTELTVANQTLSSNWEEAVRYNPAVRVNLDKAFAAFNQPLGNMLERVHADILAQRFGIAPDAYFDLATVAIGQGYRELYQTLKPTAEALIRARMVRAQQEIQFYGLVAAILFLVACFVFTGIYRSTVDSVEALSSAARKFAAGDMSQRVQLTTRDEIAQVGDSFNHMADGFSALLTAHQEDEAQLRAIVDSALDAVIQMDAVGRISGWNPQAQTIFGWSRAEALGRNLHETIVPVRYRARHLQGVKHLLATGVGSVLNSRVEVDGLHRAGHEFPIELAISSIQTTQGIVFSAFVRDISARRRSEEDLRIAAIAFETDDGIVITDRDGTTLNVNQSFTKITGYSSEEIIGRSPFILQAGRRDEQQFMAMWKALASEKAWQGEVQSRRKNGEEYPEWIRITAVSSAQGQVTNYVVAFSDISQRRQFEDTIHKLAFYDPLTNLPNRRLLLDRMQQHMATSTRSQRFGALLFIDLDHFKTLNDTRGHDVGDQLLLQVAQRLLHCVREGDTVARLGGDEFVVMLGGLAAEAAEAATQTEAVCTKVLASLGQVYLLYGTEHRSTASIGAALFRGMEVSTDELFKQAELAMYKSKERGRNAFHFFDPAMQTAVVQRAALETGLRQAIAGHQLVLHYQPQVLGDGRVTGAEALVRWQHPVRGLVSPAEFIPLAEESGLILGLGKWVLQAACEQLALWAAIPDLADLTLAVNVSAHQFRHADFVATVLTAIERCGACPLHLKLELTESVLVANVEDVVEKMVALKARGIGFSLDDFGTGYSSLAYLKRLPLDQLKIDQSFVRNILLDANDAAIARTVVALAQSLGLGVIAEGVETQAQRDSLRAAGCHAYQGYLFSRPLALPGFEAYVRNAMALAVTGPACIDP